MKSTLHLGLVSRLISPWIGANLTTSRVGVPAFDQLWWQPNGTTQFPLGIADTNLTLTPTSVLGIKLRKKLIEPLNKLGLVSSPSVMWGNAASAINGAITTIITARPEMAPIATHLGQDLITHLPAGQHTGKLGQPSFRRNSCCLINTLTPQTREATCGDCIHTAK